MQQKQFGKYLRFWKVTGKSKPWSQYKDFLLCMCSKLAGHVGAKKGFWYNMTHNSWVQVFKTLHSISLKSESWRLRVENDDYLSTNVLHNSCFRPQAWIVEAIHSVEYDPTSAHFFPCGYIPNLSVGYESIQ